MKGFIREWKIRDNFLYHFAFLFINRGWINVASLFHNLFLGWGITVLYYYGLNRNIEFREIQNSFTFRFQQINIIKYSP